MGLDAVVYCDCYEKGMVRKPPPQPELIYVDTNGQVCIKWDAPGADENAFSDWLKDACDHGPRGELASRRLGNIALIGFINSLLKNSDQRFPLLLAKVVYDGTHCGDFIAFADVERLRIEVEGLSGVHLRDPAEEEILREFQQDMSDLVAGATKVRKPIAF